MAATTSSHRSIGLPVDLLRPPSLRTLLAVYAPAFAVLGLVVVLAVLDGAHSLAFLTREPGEAIRIEGCERYACASAGLLSNIGTLVWMVGVAAATVAGLLQTGERRRLLLWAAALSLVLCVDDTFMLHDHVWANLSEYGQKASEAAMGVLGVAFVVAFRRQVAIAPPFFLLAAGGFLGVSVLTDFAGISNHLLDDGAKFLGIVSWTAWVVLAAVRSIQRVEVPEDRDRLGPQLAVQRREVGL